MSQKNLKKLHTAYGIALSAIVVILGLCFIISCLHIYYGGGRVEAYSRDIVGDHLKTLIAPVIISVLAILGGAVLSFFPLERSKPKSKIEHRVSLSRLYARTDLGKAEKIHLNKIEREIRLRKIATISLIALLSACGIVSFIYFVLPSSFPADDLILEVALSMAILIPCAVVAFAGALAHYFVCNASYVREYDILLEVFKTTIKKPDAKIAKNAETSKRGIFITQCIIVTIAVTFIIIGVFNGGMADVLQKAVNICTECIGLG